MKKFFFGLLCAIILICLLCVYGIGGLAGAYAWSLAIFIVAPVATLSLFVQLVILIARLFKKNSVVWNTGFIIVSLIMAFPITIFFGFSNITYPTKANETEGIKITAPVKNAILFGGKDYKTHAIWPSECYAYDIVSEPHDTGSDKLEDYGIFNAIVHAPVSGTIIDMKNNEPDIVPNTEEFTSSYGNYVFIRIDETETYLILAHLRENSITVGIGDHVEEGEVIGQVGNSGTTSEPHLHIQHQRNNPMTMFCPICSEALQISFK